MSNLTKNFSRHEFECHGKDCCENSQPTPDRDLLIGLQILRNRAGCALTVNSGFRCNKHNREVPGSAKNSQHPLNTAADICATHGELTPKELHFIASTIPFFEKGGIGLYDTFIHVDTRKTGKARWDERTKAS